MGTVFRRYPTNELKPRQSDLNRIDKALRFYFEHKSEEYLPIPVRFGEGEFRNDLIILDGHNRASVLDLFVGKIDVYLCVSEGDIMSPERFRGYNSELLKETNEIIRNCWSISARIPEEGKYIPKTVQELREQYRILKDQASAKKYFESLNQKR